MKKVSIFMTKGGHSFNTKQEALLNEAEMDLEYWLESHCEKDDEGNYVAESLSTHIVANFTYLTKLVNQVKENTVRQIPDEDGGM